MVSQLVLGIVSALVLTIVIELWVAWMMGCRTRHDVTTIVLVNLVTHPIFSFFYIVGSARIHSQRTIILYLLGLEIIVTLVEWQLLRRVLTDQAPPAAKLALAINGVSGSLGFLRFL